MAVPTDVALRLAKLFAGNDSWHGTHGIPEWDEVKSKWGIHGTPEKPCARTMRGAATMDHWQDHLDGEKPLGVVPVRLDENGRTVCRWGCGDVDDYSVDVVALVEKVKKMEYPLVPCRSKSGGLHLFLFLREWENSEAVQTVLRDMMASLGYAEAEIFPKQSHLVDQRDKGSWIVMPYLGTDYEGRLTHQRGVKPGGDDMTAEEFLAAAEAARTTTAEIRVQRAPRVRASGRTSGAAVAGGPDVPFGDGPPCLEHLAAQGVHDCQNNALMAMGTYFKKAHPNDWKAHLERANTAYLSPPGSADGLLSVIRSLEKKDYFYMCRQDPIRRFCNSRLCRGRRYGVGEDSEVPKIAHVLCREGEEKEWIIQVSGVRVSVNTHDFQEFRSFRLRVMEATRLNFAPMREADWSAMVSAALSTVTDVEPEEDRPPDLKPFQKFREMFQTYTSNRALARTMNELGGSRGKPWQDTEGAWGEPGRWYIRMACFERAAKETDKSYSWGRGYLRDRFEEMGGACSEREINGQGYPVWGFPEEVVKKVPRPAPTRKHGEEKI